jgi:hypothetical protein
MIQASEIQNGSMQFSVALVETAQVRLDPGLALPDPPSTRRPGELTLTASQVLAAYAAALGTVGLLLWALVNLWIFEA